MWIRYKIYFRDYRKGRHDRNLLELLVFILYLFSDLQKIYNRAWKLANLIENLKLKKALITSRINRNSKKALLNLNQTKGFNIANRVNIYLSLLTRLGHAFPIKTKKVIWKENIEKDCGVIFISVHLPLIKVAIAKLIEDGHEINAALSASLTQDGKMAFWGITKKVPIIQSGAMSLVKVKSILTNKGSIVMMADAGPLSMIYPNIFHLAAKINARILFLFAYLNEKGVIEITLTEPSHSQISDDKQLEKNITDLREAREEILIKYANQFDN